MSDSVRRQQLPPPPPSVHHQKLFPKWISIFIEKFQCCLTNIITVMQTICAKVLRFNCKICVARFRTVCILLHQQWIGLVLLLVGDVVINTLMIWKNCSLILMDTDTDIARDTIEFDQSLDHSSLEDRWKMLRKISNQANLIVYIIIYIAQGIGLFGLLKQQEFLLMAFVTIVSIELIFILFSLIVQQWLLSVYLFRLVLFVFTLRYCLYLSDQSMSTVHYDPVPTVNLLANAKSAQIQPSRTSLWSKSSTSSRSFNTTNIIPLNQQKASTIPEHQ